MLRYLSSTDSPYILNLADEFTQLLSLQDVKLSVSTAGGAVTITLPPTSQMPVQNVRIFITDNDGFAGTNNITVIPALGNKINGGLSVVISEDYGFVRLQIASPGLYTATMEGSGGGTAGGAQTLPFTTNGTGTYTSTTLIGKTITGILLPVLLDTDQYSQPNGSGQITWTNTPETGQQGLIFYTA